MAISLDLFTPLSWLKAPLGHTLCPTWLPALSSGHKKDLWLERLGDASWGMPPGGGVLRTLTEPQGHWGFMLSLTVISPGWEG